MEDHDLDTEFVHTSAVIHKQSIKATSYQIETPHMFRNSSDESEDDMSTPDVEATTFVINRSLCMKNCDIDEEDAKDLPNPKFLWWKDGQKVPDACPICHKVLFKSGRAKYNDPWTPMIAD